MTTRFGFVVAASDLHDPDRLAAELGPYRSALQARGGVPAEDVGELSELCDACPVLAVVGTGGTERRLLDLWEAHLGHRPLALVAHPGQNSLPAALEALAAVRQQGGSGRIVFLSGPDDPAGLDQLDVTVADLAADRWLQGSRIALVGGPSDWLVASSPSAETVASVWGPQVSEVPIGEVVARHRPASGARGEVAGAEGVTLALEEVVAGEYDAVSVRCFDLIGALGTTGCLALADLNDEGVVAGCEGDLPSTLAMLWTRALLQKASWMANPARLDTAAGELWLAHCTVPRSLTEEIELDTHFESGIGVGIRGRLPTGPATLIRIGGAGLERLWVADADLVGTGDADDLCRTQALVRVDPARLEELLSDPLGNHLVLVYGHHADRLTEWWELVVRPRIGLR